MSIKPVVTIFYGIDGDLKSDDSGALLRYMGGNTGNLLFRHALQECVVDLSNCDVIRLPAGVDLFRSLDAKTCRRVLSSALVIYPAANLLRPSKNYEVNPQIQRETHFITTLCQLFHGPFLVLGLGYQGVLRPEHPSGRDLHPDQIKLLDVLLRHTGAVALRGSTTLEVIRQYDIFRHAYLSVLGCPSLWISGDPQHGQSLALKDLPQRLTKIALGLPSHPEGYPELFQQMVAMAADSRVHLVVQDESDLQACRRANLPEERLHLFSSLQPWIDFLQSCDLCLTARVHGAQVAVLAKTPSLLIVTDCRMEELAKSMALNWIAVDHPDLPNLLTDWSELARHVSRFDGDAYDQNRQELAIAIIQFLNRLDLPVHPSIQHIGGGLTGRCDWSDQLSRDAPINPLVDLDTEAYLQRYPDPFLSRQNLLGLAFHAVKSGNVWASLDADQALPQAYSLDLAARVADDLVVLCGWCSDRSPTAQLMIRRAKGAPWSSLLGKIRLRRPDVAEALGCWSLKEPDFGFLLAYPLAEPGHGPVSISIFGESRAIELQDWRHRPSADVINDLLDLCQWFHTPADLLPGLLERDLGRAIGANLRHAKQHDPHQPWLDLITWLKDVDPAASTVCLVCVDDVLKARIQLQRLSVYGTLQRGRLAVVVLVNRDVACPFSGLSLLDVVRCSTADWPSAYALERPLDQSWDGWIKDFTLQIPSRYSACAVLRCEALSSASDWIDPLLSSSVLQHPGFDRLIPSLQDFSGQPSVKSAAYLQKIPQQSFPPVAVAVQTDPVLVDSSSAADGAGLQPYPANSREAWRAQVDHLLWR